MLEYFHCPPCGGEQAFHRLPCADGHDRDCPEVVCTVCGSVQTREPAPLVEVVHQIARVA